MPPILLTFQRKMSQPPCLETVAIPFVFNLSRSHGLLAPSLLLFELPPLLSPVDLSFLSFCPTSPWSSLLSFYGQPRLYLSSYRQPRLSPVLLWEAQAVPSPPVSILDSPQSSYGQPRLSAVLLWAAQTVRCPPVGSPDCPFSALAT